MIILTEKEFKANQRKYFGAANKGEEVIVNSNIGSFRLVPILDKEPGTSAVTDSNWNKMLESVSGAWKDEPSIPNDFRKNRSKKDDNDLIHILNT